MKVNNQLNSKSKGDRLLIYLVVLLAILGTIFIYSASNYSAKSTYNDSFYFVKKQLLGIVLGVIAMFFTARIDYHKLKKLNVFISIISFILLALVFVPVIGVENYGARRWINLGFLTLQPSEISKFALILFTATYMSKNPSRAKTFLGILPVLVFGICTCLLIIAEPNMSITVCVLMLMITILFASGMKIKHFLILIIPTIVVGVILILIEPYRFNRLLAFINPWANPKGEGYQLLQSLYALGSGGLFGVGLFNSRQKFAFLPFAESDFILSVIGEEIGFVGLFFFFLLIGLIVFRGLKIAYNSKDIFAFILAVGISMIFGIQAFINALVVTGSIPPTGLPLPLVSSGNTSIIIFLAEMGILFNISKRSC